MTNSVQPFRHLLKNLSEYIRLLSICFLINTLQMGVPRKTLMQGGNGNSLVPRNVTHSVILPSLNNLERSLIILPKLTVNGSTEKHIPKVHGWKNHTFGRKEGTHNFSFRSASGCGPLLNRASRDRHASIRTLHKHNRPTG